MNITFSTPYKFNDYGEKCFKKAFYEHTKRSVGLDEETEYYYYGARYYNPKTSVWLSVDPLVEQTMDAYIYTSQNPIKYTDPTGMSKKSVYNPVFGSDGEFIGTTKEGYTGEILVLYDDSDLTAEDLANMSADDVINQVEGESFDEAYDNARLSDYCAIENILTHVVSQLEGLQVYDEKFSMSSIEEGRVFFDPDDIGYWNSRPRSSYKGWNDRITATKKWDYSTTVENTQSTVIVHEWYSHIKKGQRDLFKSHRLAYKNVINFKQLWDKTTDGYKGFYMRNLLEYTKDETKGRKTQVDQLYRNIYKKYKDKHD